MKLKPLDILKIYQGNSEQLSLKEIFEDLKQISAIKKCSFCGCSNDTLKEFAELAQAKDEKKLAENATEIQIKIDSRKKYDCLGCSPCYAADISNLLFEMSDGEHIENKSESCATEFYSCNTTQLKEKWPVERGNYIVGNEKATIAINTLSNTELPKQLAGFLKDKIAIAGYCETENVGIEKIIKNIISNPNIRTLIVCGYESGKDMMGHSSGQALLSLHSNGITGKKRIIGAKGKRPVMKNLTTEQIKHFQSQIEVLDLIGNNSIEDIIQYVNIALSKKKTAFDKKEINGFENREIIAQNPQKLLLDKKGYFVILPDISEEKIYVEYYANSGELLYTIIGNDAASIYYTIIEKGFISKPDHCAYLGKELTKAEYFIKYNIPYVQDMALGDLSDE